MLNDEGRSDIRELAQRLRMMPASGLESLLDEALQRMHENGMVWKSDPILGQIVKETRSGKRAERYVAALQDYLTRGVKIIDYWDEPYPARLKYVSNAPLVLFV